MFGQKAKKHLPAVATTLQAGRKHRKHHVFSVFSCFLCFFVFMLSALIVQPAYALPVEITTDLTKVQDRIERGFLTTIHNSLVIGAVDALDYMTRKLAHDLARGLAHGCKGQNPCVFLNDPLKYATNVANEAGGELINSFGSSAFGVNLCELPDIRLNAFLKIGFHGLYLPGSGGPKPNCTLTKFADSWSPSAFEKKYGPGGSNDIEKVFNRALVVEESDFGVALGGMARIGNFKAGAALNANIERIIGQGFKDVQGLISGNIVTPSAMIRQQLNAAEVQGGKEASAADVRALLADSLSMDTLPYAAKIFLNTFASELLGQLINPSGGLVPEIPSSGGFSGSFGDFFAAPPNYSRVADQAFSFLLTPTIQQVEQYDIVGEFASCDKEHGLNNCVMEDSMRKAVARGSSSNTAEPLTIAGAIEEGLLHGDWPLIPPTRVENEQYDCYINRYCYSNIQKLRRARILPLGFEIAALHSDPDAPWTLGQVVNGFNDCGPGNAPDAIHPFCHLIDPNWILKAQIARCQSKVDGPELLGPETPVRRKECVDAQTCVKEGKNGACDLYGFCTKEKNIWRLPGADCPAEYATCSTYRNEADGSAASYLSRSLDYGECSESSVGCRALSAEAATDAGGKYQWKTETMPALGSYRDVGRNPMLYFNGKAQSCNPSDDGCTAFFDALRDEKTNEFVAAAAPINYVKTGKLVHLKKAPDYLGCYDINRAAGSPETNWPATKAELALLPNNELCNGFADACAQSEAGCESFTPLSGGDGALSIPAIVGRENYCAKDCAGYATFKQEATNFEESRFPLHFIPSKAAQCDRANAGCDEFTNLEASAQGGEKTEYYSKVRYCEKPSDNNNGKAFYSWEGSTSQGFVLKVHRIRPIRSDVRDEAGYIARLNLNYTVSGDDPDTVFSVGSPAYADLRKEALQNAYNACNKARYAANQISGGSEWATTPDCRALYDDEGRVYYRLLDTPDINQTITISASCHRVRKAESRLLNDDTVKTADDCANILGGNWVNDACQHCYGGGKLENGVCVYQTIASESKSCPAQANGCRKYTGNTGYNINSNVFSPETFEPAPANNPTDAATALARAKDNWTNDQNVRVASESLQVGGHSLQVNLRAVKRFIPAPLASPSNPFPTTNTRNAPSFLSANGWYQISFWVRGAPNQLTVAFMQNNASNVSVAVGEFTKDITTGEPQPVTVSGEWRQFTLGPVQFTGDPRGAVDVVFTRSAEAVYYLDEVRLLQYKDEPKFLIKDSWKAPVQYNNTVALADVPLACDSNPADAFPGEALGCAGYKDSRQNTYYATGFASLCREKAVGCQPVWETFNRVSEAKATAYNAWCQGTVGEKCQLSLTLPGVTAPPLSSESCVPLIGHVPPAGSQTGCYIDKVILPSGAGINALPASAKVADTIYIPAHPDKPVYLTNRKEFECDSSAKGCMKLGERNEILPASGNTAPVYEYAPAYVINDPDNYAKPDGGGSDGVLCREELIGCGKFTANNSPAFFKDPAKIGKRVCVYKTVLIGMDRKSGWFKEGVGKCSGNNALCRSSADCMAGRQCDLTSPVPCDPNYLDASNSYGLWSQKSPGYQGYVGLCEDKYNLCVELLDPHDSSQDHPKGKPYYAIYDDRLTKDTGACAGKAGLKDGCVLFDRTDRPNKIYSTALTYGASSAASPKYSSVTPQSSPNFVNNDANILLKVKRDRECSEWLACRNKIQITDEKGAKVQLCQQYKACNSADIKSGKDCANFSKLNERGLLTADTYTRRDVSWFGQDFTGFSLLNHYAITDYQYVTFDNFDKKDNNQYLAYEVNPALFDGAYAGRGCSVDSTGNLTQKDGLACGVADMNGRCYKGRCIYPIDGRQWIESPGSDKDKNIDIIRKTLSGNNACKGYPEPDSPFPTWVALDSYLQKGIVARGSIVNQSNSDIQIGERRIIKQPNPLFFAANICQDGACSCDYLKVQYQSGIKDYWATTTLQSVLIPKGICSGGERNGHPCESDFNCIEPFHYVDQNGAVAYDLAKEPSSKGTCSVRTQTTSAFGVKGFCLEYDLSRPINGRPVGRDSRKQEYACLTWLPIQTAASKVDIFNRFDDAGYIPRLDTINLAGNSRPQGGQVMCVAANTGMAYDPALIVNAQTINNFYGSYFGIVLPEVLGRHPFPFFNTSGFPNLLRSGTVEINPPNNFVEDEYACENISAPQTIVEQHYRQSACFNYNGGNISSEELYRALQAWSWRQIGVNATVLRVEETGLGGLDTIARDQIETSQTGLFATDIPRSVNDCPQAWGTCDGTTPTQNLLDGYFVSHLLSKRTYRGDLSMTNLHPPRLWIANVNDNGYCTTYHYGSTAPAFNTTLDAVFSPLGLSPEPFSFAVNGGCHNDGVYRAPHEKELRDLEVGIVHFVPIFYPLGFTDRWVPSLFNKELTLDIGRLQSSPVFRRNGNVLSVAATDPNDLRRLTFHPQPPVEALQHDVSFKAIDDDDMRASKNGFGVWNYVSAQDDGVGLLSFSDYRIPLDDLGGMRDQQVNVSSDESNPNYVTRRLSDVRYYQYPSGRIFENGNADNTRNRIFKRYVAVFFNFDSSGNPPEFIRNFDERPRSRTVNPQTNSDPFMAPCNGSGPRWMAIGMDFNREHEFLGYISKSCGVSMDFAVIATLSNKCTEFAQVYDNSANGLSEITNKAWTQRVWRNSRSLTDLANPLAHPGPSLFVNQLFNRDQSQAPFGSLRGLVGNNVSDDNLIGSYIFNNKEAGMPYSCPDASLPGITVSNPNCSALKAFGYDNPTAGLVDILTRATRDNARSAIFQLFAKMFLNRKYNVDSSSFVNGLTDPNLDKSGVLSSETSNEHLVVPQIYSLNPATCVGSATGIEQDVCTAGAKDSITINGRNGFIKDYNGDGVFDEKDGLAGDIIDQGSSGVTARFFTFADDNRMPIRQVFVDWGDDAHAYDNVAKGLYRNHKPFCSASGGNEEERPSVGLCKTSDTAHPSGITCHADKDCPFGLLNNDERVCLLASADASPNTPAERKLPATGPYSVPRFGNSPRACAEQYFEFTHTYACGDDELAGAGTSSAKPFVKRVSELLSVDLKNRMHANGLGDNDFVCQYVPKVQVMDNWGYCNGACGDANSPGGTACYEGIGSTECSESGSMAWTPYNGYIIVVPAKQ